MSEVADSRPLEHYGDMFVSADLRMSLETEMLVALQDCVDKGWFTQEQAADEYAIWHHQFD